MNNGPHKEEDFTRDRAKSSSAAWYRCGKKEIIRLFLWKDLYEYDMIKKKYL